MVSEKRKIVHIDVCRGATADKGVEGGRRLIGGAIAFIVISAMLMSMITFSNSFADQYGEEDPAADTGILTGSAAYAGTAFGDVADEGTEVSGADGTANNDAESDVTEVVPVEGEKQDPLPPSVTDDIDEPSGEANVASGADVASGTDGADIASGAAVVDSKVSKDIGKKGKISTADLGVYDVSTEAQLDLALDSIKRILPTGSGAAITITADFSINSTKVFPADRSVVMRSDANLTHVLTRGTGMLGRDDCLFRVASGAEVAMQGIIIDGGWNYDPDFIRDWGTKYLYNPELILVGVVGGSIHAQSELIRNSGVLVLGRDAVLRNNFNVHKMSQGLDRFAGGALTCDEYSDTFMSSCAVEKNCAISYDYYCAGAIVMNTDATVMINDGTMIRNNITSGGGGVVTGGRLTITGGEIRDNDGGGLHSFGNAFTDFVGGSISDNTAFHAGGGVSLWDTSELSLSGSAEILGNHSSLQYGGFGGVLSGGGGIFKDYAAKLTMTDGTVGNNTSAFNGGGIYAVGRVDISGDAQITGNTATFNGGGIYVDDYGSGAEFLITGTAVINGNQAKTGGGIGGYEGNIIWLERFLGALKVGNDVTFRGNVADKAYEPDASDISIWNVYDANVAATVFTSPFTSGYNNYDIWYVKSGGIPPSMHTVKFVDYNGRVIDTQSVPHGGSATAPAAPSRAGYTFIGWAGNYINVTHDIIVTAQYRAVQTVPPTPPAVVDPPTRPAVVDPDEPPKVVTPKPPKRPTATKPPATSLPKSNKPSSGNSGNASNSDDSDKKNNTPAAVSENKKDDTPVVAKIEPPGDSSSAVPGSDSDSATDSPPKNPIQRLVDSVTEIAMDNVTLAGSGSGRARAEKLSAAAKDSGIPTLGVPMFAPEGFAEGVWSLVDLLLMMGIIIFAVYAFVRKRGKETEEVEDDEGYCWHRDSDGGYVGERYQKRKLVAAISAALAIAAIALFIATQNITLSMVWTDSWTTVFAVAMVAQIIGTRFSFQVERRKMGAFARQ